MSPARCAQPKQPWSWSLHNQTMSTSSPPQAKPYVSHELDTSFLILETRGWTITIPIS